MPTAGPTTPPPTRAPRFPLFSDGRPSAAHGAPTKPPPSRRPSRHGPTTPPPAPIASSKAPAPDAPRVSRPRPTPQPPKTPAPVAGGAGNRTAEAKKAKDAAAATEAAEIAAVSEGHTQTMIAVREHESDGHRESLTETTVMSSRVVGGLLPEARPGRETSREEMMAALRDPTWLVYLGVLVGAMVVTLILGILLVVT